MRRSSSRLARRTLSGIDGEAIRILLIEDNPRHARLLLETMGEAGVAFAGAAPYELDHLDRLDAGLAHLTKGGIDLVLLDLSLPEAPGLAALLRVREHHPDVPVIVLVGQAEERLAAEALQAGAQDYLTKGKLGGGLVARSVRYAVRLSRMQAALRSLSLLDGLTGLYNRRGFVTLTDPHLRLAQRTKGRFLVVSADVEGLKRINEVAGYDEGDRVLRDTGEILKQTFRDSDMIARLEGRTFAALAVDAPEEKSPIISARLHQHVAGYNGRTLRRYTLSITAGFAPYDGQAGVPPSSIEDLLARAADARGGKSRRPPARRSSKRMRKPE